MIIVLNGPLGIGKSTLADALMESIDACAMISGDHLAAVNPPSKTELEHLNSGIELLVGHHLRFGYRNFVIEHVWRTEPELADLRRRLDDPEIHCFLLTLPLEENLRRIERRRSARAIDEREFELHTVVEERRMLGGRLWAASRTRTAPAGSSRPVMVAHASACSAGTPAGGPRAAQCSRSPHNFSPFPLNTFPFPPAVGPESPCDNKTGRTI